MFAFFFLFLEEWESEDSIVWEFAWCLVGFFWSRVGIVCGMECMFFKFVRV